MDNDPVIPDWQRASESLREHRVDLTEGLSAVLEGIPNYDDPVPYGQARIRAGRWTEGDATYALIERSLVTGRILKRASVSYELIVAERLDQDNGVITEYKYLPHRSQLIVNQFSADVGFEPTVEEEEAYRQDYMERLQDGSLTASPEHVETFLGMVRGFTEKRPQTVDDIDVYRGESR